MPKKKKQTSAKSEIVRSLIDAGKAKGYLSYDEVNTILPKNLVSAEEVDEVMGELNDAHIKVVESPDEMEKISLAVKSGRKSVKVRKFVQIDDPVKMYLKQMGQIPLLTRNEELTLAKHIKDTEKEFKRII